MKKLIRDRWYIIRNYIVDKEILDLGCVDHDAGQEANEHWLHRNLKSCARNVLGVDYQAKEVTRLKEKGYDVVCADVESLNLNRLFDVVIAGNIIEHLSNPGLFLEGVKRHLRPNGIFILTTDNGYGLRSLKAVLFRDRIRPNQEHTLAFEEEVLRQLLIRHGFQVSDFYYYNGPYRNPFKKWVINTLCWFRKSWAWQMLAVCTLEPPHA
ncbi:MAG: class I SAM-dependent methyltransferase [Candidatus Omnitrophica bacterium]|nr:class I SAM-dependent methyltransferase [Candidatus Omnitrophota bacterium]